MGGIGNSRTLAFEVERASICDEGTGPVGQEGLKKESFKDFFDAGAVANSRRGVTSISEAELEDGDVGTDNGTGGNGGVEEKGEAKKAWVLLPLEPDCSPDTDDAG